MAESAITTQVNPKQLRFKPGGTPAYFSVEVINNSDRFASFQLEIIAAGAGGQQNFTWYEVSPEVSTKKPPGDVTSFQVAIKDSPVPGFVGMMQLTVRVVCIELRDENREIIKLNLEQGSVAIPVRLSLPVKNFQDYPGAQVDIPVQIYNPAQVTAQILLNCLGLDSSWLTNGFELYAEIPPGKEVLITIYCQIPEGLQAVSKVYPFTIEASQEDGPTSRIEGRLEVLPSGYLDFAATPEKQTIPAKRFSWAFWQARPVQYQLQFRNESNLQEEVGVEIEVEDLGRTSLEVEPENTPVAPGETEELTLIASSPRPWLISKKIILQLHALWLDTRLETRHENQNLELQVKPLIPWWVSVLALLALLWLAFEASPLNPANTKHREAVNSVQLNGIGDQVISSSNDQTAIAWRVEGFSPFNPLTNPKIKTISRADKAIRVVAYRPVNNNLVAAGLENGDIQILDILENNPEPREVFSFQKDDRVLALEYTNNSRYLFSGHGSGRVLQWNLQAAENADTDVADQTRPRLGQEFPFAVYAMEIVGEDDDNLFVAGRFNQFEVWQWRQKKRYKVNYPYQGGKEDYIFSLDTAEFKPYRLVSSDNQGNIILWDMEPCLLSDRPCEILDQWSDGHGGEPVRSVALSADGCYLVSGGDDGRVKFWPLNKQGIRHQEFENGEAIDDAFGQDRFYGVDVRAVGRLLLVASGSEDHRVRVARHKRLPGLGCDQLK